MDRHTETFLADAVAGRTVFISDVRAAYAKLDAEESFACDLLWEGIAGGTREFHLRLPRFLSYPTDGAAFVREFFLAQMYNILCAMGGRSAVLANPDAAPEAAELVAEFTRRFQIGLAKEEREGYGRSLNVVERMLRALSPGVDTEKGFTFSLGAPGANRPVSGIAGNSARAADIFRRAAAGLEGRVLLGIDIGGTDIKLALAVDGRLAALKEFDWHPAVFADAEELIGPVVVLVELMALAASAGRRPQGGAIDMILGKAMRRDADAPAMRGAVELLREKLGGPPVLFDAIGVSFPDVVVADKIVGGESPKTKGMRDALGAGYEREYAKITELSSRLAPFVKKGGRVGIVNDGPMAAFTAGVEMAVSDGEQVARGVFAHTLGTDLGTGWVDEAGRVPDIPLEAYGFVIDLGSYPERRYAPDDVRSVNNVNTGLPGSPQKYASQSGVFRLAVKYFSESRPELLRELHAAGFLAGDDSGELCVPTSPRDMRKPFLEFMMDLMEREADPVVHRIFEEVGASLAAVGAEIDWILSPAARRRFLFGRLVKRDFCFRLIARGAAAAGSSLEFAVADESLAETPLMRELGGNPDFTVAQFAQAVGAIYYANYRLEENA